MMKTIQIAGEALRYVLELLYEDGLYLILGVLVAVAIKVYVNFDKIKERLSKRSGVSIFSSVAFGAFTPFCACGTMAVVLPMLFAALPWSVVMAFLTSSALMSPSGFVFYAGVIGVGFATAIALTSVFIGLGSGVVTAYLQKRYNFFDGALLLRKDACCATQCCSTEIEDALKAYTLIDGNPTIWEKLKAREFAKEVYAIGIKYTLPFFCIFALLAFFVERFVPTSWIVSALGSDNFYSVPAAALVGLPLYVGMAGAVPLIQTLMKSGASQGALLAFLVTGPGTSVAVMTGLSIIIKKKVLVLYIFFILLGSIIAGYTYNLYNSYVGNL